jgi:flagellar L-ring protein precursor FlgH
LKRALALVTLAATLAGCAVQEREIGREPHLTPVGSGLTPVVDPLGVANFPPPYRAGGAASRCDVNRGNMVGVPGAMTVGDVLTVNISINDKATLDNTSNRESDSTISNGFTYNLAVPGFAIKPSSQLDSKSVSKATGTGTVDRSEKIQLSVAAVVTGVLPDGNLVVSGSQEVRVNYELRLLNVAGIVRPRDISKDNTISYEKIAEARISYGGRGRSSEIQQPGWGQQIYDAVKPF